SGVACIMGCGNKLPLDTPAYSVVAGRGNSREKKVLGRSRAARRLPSAPPGVSRAVADGHRPPQTREGPVRWEAVFPVGDRDGVSARLGLPRRHVRRKFRTRPVTTGALFPDEYMAGQGRWKLGWQLG